MAKSDPNIKTFNFCVDWINEINKGIDGYMDNKKLLVAVALKLLHNEWCEIDKRKPDEIDKFATKILTEVEEIKELVDVKLRLSPR